jgi:hypothetical protein
LSSRGATAPLRPVAGRAPSPGTASASRAILLVSRLNESRRDVDDLPPLHYQLIRATSCMFFENIDNDKILPVV